MKTILIKKITFLTLLISTFIACETPAYISGKLEGVEKAGEKVYLIQPETLKSVAASYVGKIIDSALVDADGNFTFYNSPKTKEAILLEIALQQPGKLSNYLQTDTISTSNFMPIIWEVGETIQITAKVAEFQKSFSIENPSAANKALLNLRDINQKAYNTYIEGKNWQVEIGDQLLDKEHAILNYQKELMQFADTTPHLIPALVAMRWVSPENYYERVPEFLVRQCEKWQKAQPNHPWVQQLCEQSNPANLPILVGSVFPNLKLSLITKDTISINDQLGEKLTIIDVWASWCAPCRIENREILVPIWNEFHNEGIQIIAYGLESDASAWKAAIERDRANGWLQASDLLGDDTPFLKQIRLQTIPANFILDEKGVVIAKNIHGKDLIDWVQNYMEKNK